MINFDNLELRVNKKYSFVGIEREGDLLVFHLPKGFPRDDISLNTFDSKRDLFFRFYKVFKVFESVCAENNETKNKISDRDGVAKENEGAEITTQPEDEKTIVYSKVDFLDSILEVYDELKILALVSRLGRSEAIDYSQLHRYLNRGIFLPNNAIYIDSMTLPRLEVRYDEADIAAMYSYILTEVKQQVNEAVNPEIIALSERFKQKYIGFDGSLFSGEYYNQIMELLKDALELIDSRTPLKEPDYWDFYDAIEAFLFGEVNWNKEGEIWGVNNFHSVWESMCLTYLVKTTATKDILHLDRQFISSQFRLGENNAFNFDTNLFKFNRKQLLPDALKISQVVEDTEKFERLSADYGNSQFEASYWNDFNYLTQYNCSFINFSKLIKMAYENQPEKIHTQDYEPTKGESCYSYWQLSKEIEEIEVFMMQKLNHVFYAAFQENLFYLAKFKEFFSSKGNVISSSLFRQKTDIYNYQQIYKQFCNFCHQQYYFNVIDIKYLNFDDFIKPSNLEEIKRRSIRKQFVYEYQIQKHLEKSKKLFKEWETKSEFWLPVYSPNGPTFSEGPEYLDGYIKLVGVNIIHVIDKYVEDYATG